MKKRRELASEVEERKVERLAADMRLQGATLRGKTVEGMTRVEEKAALAADERIAHDPELEALYVRAVALKRKRTILRIICVALTLGGAVLSAYAVVDFTHFTAQAGAAALVDANSSGIAGLVQFVPPNRWFDVAVRSQGTSGGIVYLPLLERSAAIASWQQYTISHLPQADLSVLYATIVTSLCLDFIAVRRDNIVHECLCRVVSC